VIKKAIVTGHTRGLGAALAAQLEAEGWDVLGVARSGGARVDLGDPAAVTAWIDGGTLRAHVADADEILLINNAGVLGPADVVGAQDPAAAALAVAVNVTPPACPRASRTSPAARAAARSRAGASTARRRPPSTITP
jgi:NAD(P)-dependent dehydrogenase (short-subunit alcohol dehydrogenase family)